MRPVRAARNALAVARVLPRYLWLLARDRLGRPASQAAWDRTHGAAAREMKAVALSLAGLYVKAAQIEAARADMLPAPFIDELSQFHDAVPPRPFAQLRPILERELGEPVESLFRTFDEQAIAAASLAQVHAATLHDGREVVVKIQYPEIARIMPLDLHIASAIARLANLLQSRVDVRSLATEVTRFIEMELDFRREVISMGRLSEILGGRSDVVVPRVCPELCTERVIVMERLHGIQVSHLDALAAAGHRTTEVARAVGNLYGSMIFEYGFFHGDPHPGNLLVLEDGRIGLLDFGMCKELPPGFANSIAHMIVSALIGDAETALDAATKLGFEVERISRDHLRALFLMTLGDSDGGITFLDIVSAAKIRRIPEDFALVARTMVLLNGLSHRLAPGRRLIQAQLVEHLARGAAAHA